MRNFIIVAGLAACIIIVVYWVNALSEIEVGVYVPEAGEDAAWRAGGGAYWRDPEGGPGLSPEAAAEKRSQVNTTYGLWLAIIIGTTGGLFYIANEKDKKTKELKTWYETEGKKEIEEILKEDNVNSHVEKEQDSKKPAEKEIIDCPYCLEQIYAGAIKCKHCKTDLK